ncbi:unnamed protein product [Phytophthora lilii]|uniref:Unnamed protein product n=1 Tax=Phytophthora lilii TaxID=2077276 RepID=A0A9W6WI16_9STRA|nr:unnamed protein product [Phytophthora lilii]
MPQKGIKDDDDAASARGLRLSMAGVSGRPGDRIVCSGGFACTVNGDGDFPLGALALSESPLGVGYGCGDLAKLWRYYRIDLILLLVVFCRTHYAEIYLGIPAQRASVIVDTGSHLTALPCSTCDGCGVHTDPLFDVSKSTTAKYLACKDFDSCRTCEQDRCYISQSYMEGSMWQAVMVDELVWVGGFSSKAEEVEGVLKTFGFRFPVGCQTKETGLFITQKENGIMGLGRHRSTVMSYMLNAGRVTQNLFTLCFTGDGGELVFGGVDYSHHTSDVGYTPLLNDNSAYYPVHVKDILVNGVSLGIAPSTINSGRGVIVDSGTTDTFFDGSGKRSFMKAFSDAAGRDYSEKQMKLSSDELAALPVISIILSGMKGDGSDDVQLDVPASQYLTPSDDGSAYYGNFHFSERSGGVGFAQSDCGTFLYATALNEAMLTLCTSSRFSGKGYTNASTAAPITITATDKPGPENVTLAPSNSLEPSLPTNTSSNNSSSVKSNMTATALANGAGSVDTASSSYTATTTKRSSPPFGAFIAEIILITLVGVALAVMVWTRWRTRTWSRIPDATESSRAQMQTIVDINDADSLSPTSPPGSVLSPRSRGARRGPSPKFTIGSSGEEDELREEEEEAGSPTTGRAFLGRLQGPRTDL